MAVSMVGIGAVELLFVLASGGGLFGMPPGDRDAAFLNCAPADTAVYVEWAQRSAGEAVAPGIDGLAADPEIREFLKQVEQAILDAVAENTAGGSPEEQLLGKALPGLIKRLLNCSGCLYLNYDNAAAKKAAGAAPKAKEDKPATEGEHAPQPGMPAWINVVSGLQATLIVNGGDGADAIAADVAKLLELLPAATQTDNMQRQPLPLPLPGLKLTLHRHENYFIVGFGANTIDAAVAGLSGKSKGLAENERFQQAMKHIAIERTAGVSWIDVKGIVAKVTEALPVMQAGMVQGIVKMVGGDAIDSISSATGVADGRILSKTFLATGGRTDGILSLFAGRTLKPADVKNAPADADLVMAFSLNASKILATVKEIFGKAHPPSAEVFEKVLGQFESEFGASIEDDILQAFGDVWVFHDSPAAGGLFITSLTGSLEVRDTAKAKKVFSQAMKTLEGALPGETRPAPRRRGVFMEQGTFMDRTIYFINTVGDDDIPFAPAFCLTDKHLLVAPHPQALKAHLRFRDGRRANFTSRLKGLVPSSEGELLSMSYFDTKSLVRYFYTVVPYFGQVILSELQREGVPLNIFSLPSAEAVLPYVGNSVSTVVRTKDGILFEGETALPMPGSAGALLGMPVMFFTGVTRMRAVGEMQRARVRNLEAAP